MHLLVEFKTKYVTSDFYFYKSIVSLVKSQRKGWTGIWRQESINELRTGTSKFTLKYKDSYCEYNIAQLTDYLSKLYGIPQKNHGIYTILNKVVSNSAAIFAHFNFPLKGYGNFANWINENLLPRNIKNVLKIHDENDHKNLKIILDSEYLAQFNKGNNIQADIGINTLNTAIGAFLGSTIEKELLQLINNKGIELPDEIKIWLQSEELCTQFIDINSNSPDNFESCNNCSRIRKIYHDDWGGDVAFSNNPITAIPVLVNQLFTKKQASPDLRVEYKHLTLDFYGIGIRNGQYKGSRIVATHGF